jgi:hypothetical protein
MLKESADGTFAPRRRDLLDKSFGKKVTETV